MIDGRRRGVRWEVTDARSHRSRSPDTEMGRSPTVEPVGDPPVGEIATDTARGATAARGRTHPRLSREREHGRERSTSLNHGFHSATAVIVDSLEQDNGR